MVGGAVVGAAVVGGDVVARAVVLVAAAVVVLGVELLVDARVVVVVVPLVVTGRTVVVGRSTVTLGGGSVVGMVGLGIHPVGPPVSSTKLDARQWPGPTPAATPSSAANSSAILRRPASDGWMPSLMSKLLSAAVNPAQSMRCTFGYTLGIVRMMAFTLVSNGLRSVTVNNTMGMGPSVVMARLSCLRKSLSLRLKFVPRKMTAASQPAELRAASTVLAKLICRLTSASISTCQFNGTIFEQVSLP